MYQRIDDPETGRITITPYCDRIAEYIIERMHVVSFKDMLYAYDPDLGYYRENSHMIEAEAIRVLNGILHDVKSGSVLECSHVVMKFVIHKNRAGTFPFINEHKVIPVKNGILKIDIITGSTTLEENDPAKYRFNYVFPIEYNPDASTEPVITELSKYVDDYRHIIQMLAQTVAQTLTNQPFKKAYFLYGEKYYGKSFIGIDLFQKRFLSRDSVAKIPLYRLSNDSDNRFSLAGLEGKQANIKDELAFFNLRDANTFKEVTGTYEIWAEPKGKMPYAAWSTAVHVFISNRLARFDDSVKDDDAFWERVFPIEFATTRFERDTHAADRILTPEFMSGLLNLVLGMVIEMLQTGDLCFDYEWEDSREAWMQNSEPAYRFILENMERCVSDNTHTAILKKDLLRLIQRWYDENFSDPKYRPSTVNELVNVVKMCGGQIDERRSFYGKMYDSYGHVVYAKNPRTNEVIKDENGNPIPKEGYTQRHCFVLPWRWKPRNVYGNDPMIKQPYIDTEYTKLQNDE
ncbi:DNA primase/helicase, phage-associated [Methanosarcina siciliae C2J]|uniref:DNA primase/helicase, phage-associated n=1 Tax=Methanosarcina siciliae C2J TaxID=1434118 RepID=A0A0E3PLC3_9EURY|nr:DUF5906 domain-containing protein [Methanosarcina siciliae]AKB35899.1 DNA primase/helicase, phage-associated [Methanosarcina siciliae C2J]